MSDNFSNNKRIAKNTLLLYGRMLLMMLIGLYTSRVVLNALGVEDYGIYNVVGGVVSMFTLLSGSLSASISRFITFELGKGNREDLNHVFCASVNVQVSLIIIITILLESIGLWFLNNKLVIPADRLNAANWVFQLSVATFAVNLWSVPYNATIIAHEKMSVFALIGLFESCAKLLIAFAILKNPIDRLVFYSILIFLVGLIQRSIYTYYCKTHFEECKYKFFWDTNKIKEIFGFTGWNFIGASAAVLNNQGGNILLNLFCGPAVNAARGVAMSINHSVSGFVHNFMTALNPQITKSYASGNRDYMFNLIFRGARFSYYILLILVLPILFSTHYILELWLGIVPEHADTFAQLVLLLSLTDSLAYPLVTAMLATGKIKTYQIVVGGLQLFNLPLCYISLYIGFPPESVFVISIIVAILSEMARVIMLKNMIGLSVRKFIEKVFVNVLLVSFLAAIIPFLFKCFLDRESFVFFCEITALSILCSIFSVLFIGCNKSERNMIFEYGTKWLNKFKRSK